MKAPLFLPVVLAALLASTGTEATTSKTLSFAALDKLQAKHQELHAEAYDEIEKRRRNLAASGKKMPYNYLSRRTLTGQEPDGAPQNGTQEEPTKVGCGQSGCDGCNDAESCTSGNCLWNSADMRCDEDLCKMDHCEADRNLHCWGFEDCGETQVACRDCREHPDQACYGAKGAACDDNLFKCGDLDMADEANIPAGHPCKSDKCKFDRYAAECVDEVYQFCCDPDLADDCELTQAEEELRNQGECTAQGCSLFMNSKGSYDKKNFDDSTVVCPFEDNSLCESDECRQFKQDIYESFEIGVCDGRPHCLDTKLHNYSPKADHHSSVNTGTNGLASNFFANIANSGSGSDGQGGSNLGEVFGRRLMESDSPMDVDQLTSMLMPHCPEALGACLADDVDEQGHCSFELSTLLTEQDGKDEPMDWDQVHPSLDFLEDCIRKAKTPTCDMRYSEFFSILNSTEHQGMEVALLPCLKHAHQDMGGGGSAVMQMMAYMNFGVSPYCPDAVAACGEECVQEIITVEGRTQFMESTLLVLTCMGEHAASIASEELGDTIFKFNHHCPTELTACTENEACNQEFITLVESEEGGEPENPLLIELHQCVMHAYTSGPGTNEEGGGGGGGVEPDLGGRFFSVRNPARRRLEEGPGEGPDSDSGPSLCHVIQRCAYEFAAIFGGDDGMGNCAVSAAMSGYSEDYGISQDDFNLFKQVTGDIEKCGGEEGEGEGNGKDSCMGSRDGWDFEGQCNTQLEGVEGEMCGVGCCATTQNLLDGLLDFGGPEADTFVCGQVAPKDTCTIKTCMRQTCGGCFPPKSGPLGPPRIDAYEARKDDCVETLHTYCTAHPDEKACVKECPFRGCDPQNMECPCGGEGKCEDLYAAGFVDTAKCAPYRRELMREYVVQGFYQPENFWMREYMESRRTLRPPAEKDAEIELVAKLESLRGECEAEVPGMAAKVDTCAKSTVEFCNTDRGMSSASCRSMSVCGDGVVSWGEECDDGNSNDFNDGCMDCAWVDPAYVCPEPGKPCERCKAEYQIENGRVKGCPFCKNRRLPDTSSPCYFEECKKANDYASAKKCDDDVEEYCERMEEKGLFDPGCEIYEKKAPLFSVPVVPGSCTYSIRKLKVSSESLKEVKVALIECPFVDPTGQAEAGDEAGDATPHVPYWAPFYGLTQDEKDELEQEDSETFGKLRALARYPVGEMVPLTVLTSHELFREDDTLVDENGDGYFTGNYPAEQLVKLSSKDLAEPEGGDKPMCDWVSGNEVFVIPPCDDPMAYATQYLMKSFKRRAKDEGKHSPFAMYADLDTDEFDLTCESKKGVFQAAVLLGTVNLEHTMNGRQKKVERPEYLCDQSAGWVPWEDQAEKCTKLETLFKSGKATMKFGQHLYQKGCKDDRCRLKMAKCLTTGVMPARPDTRVAAFSEKSEKIQEAIQALTDATSQQEVDIILTRVNTLAVSGPIANAKSLFSEFTVEGTVSKTRKAVENYCEHEWGIWDEETWTYEENPDWAADPCCNWELREYMCCAPKDVPGGTVKVIEGFNEKKLQGMCRNPSKIQEILRDLRTQIEQSETKAEVVGGKVSLKDDLEDTLEGCQEKVDNREDGKQSTCTTDADCYCQYSTCAEHGHCETAEEDLYKCNADCFYLDFGEEYPMILGFLQEQWGLSPDASIEEFEEQWGEHMTVEGCVGPESRHPEIGHARYDWECDETCQEENTCSSDDYNQKFVNELNQAMRNDPKPQFHEAWKLNMDASICEGEPFNGEFTCIWRTPLGTCAHGSCRLPNAPESMPCEDRETCRSECYKPCQDPDFCASNEGSWIEQHDSGYCCPKEMHVITKSTGEKECSFLPPGAPQSKDLDNELCCAANGGKWQTGTYGGECCLGEFKEYCDAYGDCHTYCQDTFEPWEECQTCEQEQCGELITPCNECRKGRESCCSMELMSEDKDVCLSYEGCNDPSVKNEQQCVGYEDGFCSTKWGDIKNTPARCEFDIRHGDKQDCASLGGQVEYEWGRQHCLKVLTNSTSSDFTDDGEDAYESGCFPDVCDFSDHWDMQYTLERPEYGDYTRAVCESGCYFPPTGDVADDVVDADACAVEGSWYGTYNDDTGFCHFRNKNIGEPECDSLEGTYVPVRLSYTPPMFSNQEQCEEAGECQGSVRDLFDPETDKYVGKQPWSQEQCKRLSGGAMCSRFCVSCRASDSDVQENGNGACFNETLGVFEMTDDGQNEAACESSGLEWFTCPEVSNNQQNNYGWQQLENFCSEGEDPVDFPAEVAEALSCYAHHDRCETEEKCVNSGECSDSWEMRTRKCNDAGWAFGDEWYGEEIVESESSGGGTTSTTEWVSCQSTETIDGVCIEARVNGGCDDNKWHRFGCKAWGLYNRDDCEAEGKTWYDRAYDKQSCLQSKACVIDYRMTQLSTEECETCDGKLRTLNSWRGGKWIEPRTRTYDWFENGREWGPVNRWVRKQAPWDVIKQEMNVPAIRAYAMNKKTELFLMFNVYTDVLNTVACDCGAEESDTSCFQDTAGDGATTAELRTFASCDTSSDDEDAATELTGPGITIQFTPKCDEEAVNDRRRLAEARRRLETEDTAESITLTHLSAAGQTKLSPCTGDDATFVDAVVVRTSESSNAVVGQLIGDGLGVFSSEAFSALEFCLEARDDIRQWNDQFDTMGVAVKEGDVYLPYTLSDEDIESQTDSKICISVSENGIYYPMLTVSDAIKTAAETECATLECSDSSICVADASASESASCLCHCGFSGDFCDAGCPNDCSGTGTCAADNTCECDSNGGIAVYTGEDCGTLNCPEDPELGKCSRNGNCKLSGGFAVCECDDGFDGNACENTVITNEVTVDEDSSFDDDEESEEDSLDPDDLGLGEPEEEEQVPTLAPTKAPVNLREVEPVATVKLDFGSEIPVASGNSSVGDFIAGIESGLKNALGDAAAADENVQVVAVVEVKEVGALTFNSEPDDTAREAIKQTLIKVRCGDLVCTLEFYNRRRLEGEGGFELEFGVTLEMDKDTNAEDIDSSTDFASDEFANSFLTVLEVEATAAGVVVEVDEVALAEPMEVVTEVRAVAKIVMLEESGEDSLDILDDIQESVEDSTGLLDSIAEDTGLDTEDLGEVAVDLCEGRTCSDQGTCAEGECTCDEGFMGVNCGDNVPTASPTASPTMSPSPAPTASPTAVEPDTDSPTGTPVVSPTNPPTDPPTNPPTNPPTDPPTSEVTINGAGMMRPSTGVSMLLFSLLFVADRMM